MSEAERHDIEIGEGEAARRIAVLRRAGRAPQAVWLGGFLSDMAGTKAGALDAWGAAGGNGTLRFDYSGHGVSGGAFTDGTIGRWLEEAEGVLHVFGDGPPILVGSSMGGWIALLLALRLKAAGTPAAGLLLIAPAVDMTERLMWEEFSDEARREIETAGLWHRPSAYGEPYPITRALIEEGRGHLLFPESTIETGCPVHILHGRDDDEVPLDVALDLTTALAHDDVGLTIVHDGDHRLSRPQDIALLQRCLTALATRAHAPSPAA